MNKAFETIFILARRLLIIFLLGFAIFNVALPSWKKILVWQLNDNDDIMRILEVRAWLGGQGFYDIINHRLNPPNGGDMHWSRLADIPLALCELILRPFFGIEMAEKMGVFATPLILAIIFAYIAGRAAKAVTNSYIALYLAGFMAISTPGVMGYFTAGRVDHHGLQLIFMACAFWGLLSHNKKGAILAGLSIPASLTIGFELAPIMVLMVAWVAIIWAIRGDDLKQNTKYFSIALLVGTILGFIINVPPSEYLIMQNDAWSLAQISVVIAGSFCLLLAVNFAGKYDWKIRFAALFIIGIIVIAIALQFPILRKPPYWQTNELLQRLWLKAVIETFPLLKMDKPIAINLGMFALFGSIATIIKLGFVVLKNQDFKSREVDNWSLLAPILALTTFMAIFGQARFSGQAAAVAVIAVSALLVDILDKKTFVHAALAGLILNPLIPSSAAALYTKLRPKPKGQFAVGGGANCQNDNAYSALAKMPKGKIVSHIDFGAHALISTHHDVLAAPYHRNLGNFVAYDILLTPANLALAKLKANDLQYVAYCKKSAEIGILEREAPNGLMADLKKGEIPEYLRPIPTPNGSDIYAFMIVK
jgi:hypothetical protein